MQSDLEVLLKLLVIDYQFRAEYLSVEVLGRGFDLDGLFVPVNAAQVVFYIGQQNQINAARVSGSDDLLYIQKLCGLFWFVSEYGGEILPNALLVYDEGLSYYWDGIRLIIQEYAAILIASRNFDNSPPSRSFDEVFMQESFPLT
jgi:hypothetical protein